MARRGSGLRNRNRRGQIGTYARKGKGRSADRYGTMNNGQVIKPDSIAGRIVVPLQREEA